MNKMEIIKVLNDIKRWKVFMYIVSVALHLLAWAVYFFYNKIFGVLFLCSTLILFITIKLNKPILEAKKKQYEAFLKFKEE